MPDLIRYPVIPLESAIGCAFRLEKLHWVPGFRRNDKCKVFIRRFNNWIRGNVLNISAFPACIRILVVNKLPSLSLYIVANDIKTIVTIDDLKIAVIRAEPTIDNRLNRDGITTHFKRSRLLLPAIPRVAGDCYRDNHGNLIISIKLRHLWERRLAMIGLHL